MKELNKKGFTWCTNLSLVMQMSDNDTHDGMPQYLRGKLDEGEAVTLVDGPEITHNDINLGELFESDISIEGEDWCAP